MTTMDVNKLFDQKQFCFKVSSTSLVAGVGWCMVHHGAGLQDVTPI